MQYTFTTNELRQLLANTIKTFSGQESVYDFSEGAQAADVAIEKIITGLIVAHSKIAIDKCLKNIPTLEEIQAEGDGWREAFETDIPFGGKPVAYETTDNISPGELGLVEAM